ncbi:MAG TPA: hypothetical protein VGU72_25470 [Beijerinckiaceae bacterium]|jgi:hypothetical protein|nr:hypothetical protein [Beijerinckiaceae bacterium]
MSSAVAAIDAARPNRSRAEDKDAKLLRLYARWRESYTDMHLAVLAMKGVPGDDPRMDAMEAAMGKPNAACARLEFQMCAIPVTTLEGFRAKATAAAMHFDGCKSDTLAGLRDAIDSRDNGDAFLASLIIDLADWDFLANPQGVTAQ